MKKLFIIPLTVILITSIFSCTPQGIAKETGTTYQECCGDDEHTPPPPPPPPPGGGSGN